MQRRAPRNHNLIGGKVRELIEAYQAGETTYALADRFSIHRFTVSEHLKRAGVETQRGRRAKVAV
jgi:hypothetical protein